jgi:hypothetical protein
MKAITVRQPWAAWIFTPHPDMGVKDVENRTWLTQHRGRLAIHAGQKIADGFSEDDIKMLRGSAWTRGAIIGVVDLVDIVPVGEKHTHIRGYQQSGWEMEGHHWWLLANPRLLPAPIQLPGRPGLFDVDLDVDYSKGA